MSKKIVIVGGVAGGATAAARLRRLDEESHIILFERGEHISFANCGLPYYIGDVIQNRDALLVQTVEGMSKKFNLDIRNRSEVTSIDRDRKVILVNNLNTNETYEESYDVLILSPGAKPMKPPIPGIEQAEALFTLRNIPDTDRIKNYVDHHQPKTAVVIGGGFIGVEMAENLHERGIHVSLIELGKQIMTPVDYEMAAIIQQHMVDKGMELILEDGVHHFEAQGKKVVLNSGKAIDTDMVILAIGVIPENSLAKDAGLELGVRGTIKVNETLQTADPSIYAIGDAIEVTDFINGQPTMIPLAWPANRQGRIVADHIYGRKVRYPGTLGTSIAKIFDLTVAATGNNEKTCKLQGIDYEAIHIHPNSHAGYYPGATPISLKLIFDPNSGKIFGAQAVGRDGVDKRIDVIATAIKGGLTVMDLPDLELSYAPPYSSAKDPVNMAGYVASNIVEGDTEIVQWHEIDEIVAQGGLLVDVREPIEREMGSIPGSINIPLGELRDRLNELPRDTAVYVSCQVGLRGYLATRILQLHGIRAINVDGGYKTYSSVKWQVTKTDDTPITDNGLPEVPVNQVVKTNSIPDSISIQVDVCGLQCPGPIMKVAENMNRMQVGDVLEIKATDPGFSKDIQAWCKKTGNMLLSTTYENNAAVVRIQKGSTEVVKGECSLSSPATKDGATFVVFSGELDKAMASFIIACGAAAMGKEVTMFFTFWGLNILRKEQAPSVEKEPMEKMFGMMMPKGAYALPLSNMNMMGIGTKMMKNVMKQKNVDDIHTLINNAQAAGVHFVACAMSMDVMGIKPEELIDGVEVAGVATYLGKTDDSNLNLFI